MFLTHQMFSHGILLYSSIVNSQSTSSCAAVYYFNVVDDDT